MTGQMAIAIALREFNDIGRRIIFSTDFLR